MKAKKKEKPRGIKHKIREGKKREERISLAVTVAILIAIISVSGFLINSMLTSPSQNQERNSTPETRSELKAAIVDQLSLTYPNQTFIETATNTLKQAGYTVDYYPGERVTVEFYRDLPTHGYRLILLRVHSAAGLLQGAEVKESSELVLFTSEAYNQKEYLYEQLTDQVRAVARSKEGPDYFGISSEFVKFSMNGKFLNTIIIMMGCDGLRYNRMAEAFLSKGAKVYISWDASVLATHTDLATTHLLQHLLIEKRTLKESVQETFKEVGQDPAYKSQLIYYPLDAGEQTIQDIIG